MSRVLRFETATTSHQETQVSDNEFDFTEFLAELGHGAINQQAGQRVRSLVRACIEHGGRGKMTVTIDVKAGSNGLVEVKAGVKATEPSPTGVSASYFTTTEGALVTEDPRQTSMPARILQPTPIRGGGAS